MQSSRNQSKANSASGHEGKVKVAAKRNSDFGIDSYADQSLKVEQNIIFDNKNNYFTHTV